MFKRTLVIAVLCSLPTVPALAQIRSDKLAFLIPGLYGPYGLTLPTEGHEAHFNSDFQNNFTPFNSAIGSQLTVLPIPSPASGFTYTFDPSLGVYQRSAQSFGPILVERAETLGKNKFSFGFSYQHFKFDTLDELDLNQVSTVFQHLGAGTPGGPAFQKDLITANNSIALRLSQFTSFFSIGLTDKLDLSVAVPFIRTDLSASSDATIQDIGTSIHSFSSDPNHRVTHQFFSDSGSASGIGDIIVRLKGTAKKWEHAGLAFGGDFRIPTGDELDLLGSGTVGIKPFMVLSFPYNRVSPHINVGYLWNGKSLLAGDVVKGIKGHLPDQFLYAGGLDIGFTERFTLAFDIVGQRLVKAERAIETTFTSQPDVLGNTKTFPQIAFQRSDLNLTNGSAGFKINAVGGLLITFNALFKLNDVGLRAKVSPLIGVTYTF